MSRQANYLNGSISKRFKIWLLALLTIILGPAANAQDDGFKSIFDGKSLNGWQGDTKFWSVQDGAIVAETTPDKQVNSNIFLVWSQGEVDDFVLKFRFRISGTARANSGVQFRSSQASDGHLAGYQADIDRSGKYIGIIYDERGRGILANRGERVEMDQAGKKTKQQSGNADDLLTKIRMDDWNDYTIRASGNELTTEINGHVMAQFIDNDQANFDRKGLLGLQLHAGPPMKIAFKDIRLKRLPLADGEKKVVFVAGRPSHGWGSHEHHAGCLLLANRLDDAARQGQLPIVTTVYKDGWPQDPTALDNADTVVAYCDGGKRHYLHENMEAFDQIMRDEIGLVCLHYGVEVPKGPSGQLFLQTIGGYFETHWSVNPHWVANFDAIPDHPVANGVKPFSIKDEWYYHMRFSPEMTRVTPILTALPPADTLRRPDGPHSNNEFVKAAVLKDKQPQHVAWAFVRGDGKGRGFGFTGGHFHRNWQNNDFRKIVLNAIVWTAHLEVPKSGVSSPMPTYAELDANQDYPKPSRR